MKGVPGSSDAGRVIGDEAAGVRVCRHGQVGGEGWVATCGDPKGGETGSGVDGAVEGEGNGGKGVGPGGAFAVDEHTKRLQEGAVDPFDEPVCLGVESC